MIKNKWEIIGITIIICATIILFTKKNSEESRLKRDGVYVIGHLIDKNFGADQGWVYSFEYKYNNKKYVRKFTGPIKEEFLSDSLMFFHILPKKPEICRQITNERVPECFKNTDIGNKFWIEIPDCK